MQVFLGMDGNWKHRLFRPNQQHHCIRALKGPH